MSLYVNDAGLAGVAGQLAAQAQCLAALAATPPVHSALAVDEVSTSASARLTEHGAVMASRAADAAEVMRSAAMAVQEMAAAYGQMDRDNATTMSLQAGAGAGVTPAFTPAVTTNLAVPDVSIVAAPFRDGEISAAMMEGGSSQAGSAFVSSCQRYGAAFSSSSAAARAAQAAVDESLRGQAGPRLSAALQRFAAWADRMSSHTDTVAMAAGGHGQRFDTAHQDTPRTQAFTSKKRELTNAQLLNQRYAGAYSGVVTKLQSELASLHSQAGFASANYHIGELPAAPPPPPPVAPVVEPTGPGGKPANDPATSPGDDPATRRAAAAAGEDADSATGSGEDLAAVGESGLDGLGPDGAPLTDPALAGVPGQGDPMSQAAPMAAMLPSLLAGVLGGTLGAVASVPSQIGQQIQSVASQAGQAMEGLTKGLSEPDLGKLDASGFDGGSLGDFTGGGGGGVGGGGDTEPAAGPLPAASGGMLAAGAPGGATGPIRGASPAAGIAPAAAAGMGGGMPMMMPPMAGVGGQGGGARAVKDPDKNIHLPGEANAEMVKGEVQRRETAVADDPIGEKKRAAAAAPSTVTSRRRIELPKDQ
ncbi:PE domain-containing protein [Mycobacterium sp. CVI_P3]|uniref:PE domain-containing protein n=1 Tax=Mycobacterium pinniadriaticum TaxID=2994102 RepID=A0ABT3SGF4_9MYCO|nr:PE domain-containing protein [Mycobacterium pinniadriaticum]MCX2931696.1 PE domain-containing protein [Mycobacterium pinniadriaticum]MCX2938229.1 PE domain-containing protein [Mycobacterium pinniadriaticum]